MTAGEEVSNGNSFNFEKDGQGPQHSQSLESVFTYTWIKSCVSIKLYNAMDSDLKY